MYIFVCKNHNIPGTGTGKHIWDVICEYAKTNKNNNITLVLEVHPTDFSLFENHTNGPLRKIVKEFRSHKKPENINIIFGNIRRDSQFSILEIIYDLDTYYMLNYYRLKLNTYEAINKFETNAKKFEKVFYQNVKTRETCIKFFISLVHPDVQLPVWFTEYLNIFEIYDKTNPLKTMLAKIRSKDIAYFNGIMNTLETMFEYHTIYNPEYSIALQNILSTQERDTKRMVANRYIHIQGFWVAVNAILVDIYIMCLMYIERYDTFFAIFGVNHIQNIIKHLAIPDKNIISAFSPDGHITKNMFIQGRQHHNLVPHSPISLMRLFKEARNKSRRGP